MNGKTNQNEDPLREAMVRVNKILKENSSGRLACVDDVIETGVAEEDILAGGLPLEGRICQIFQDNCGNFTGIDLDNLNDDDKVRVIAARAPDHLLIKMTEWIISDLKDVLLNITSRGPAIILEELISKLSLKFPNKSH